MKQLEVGDKEEYFEHLEHKRAINADLAEFRELNQILNDYGFYFISPLFYQGFELHHFRDLHNAGKLTTQLVERWTKQKFYNLNWTAGFVDGYCARSPFVAPFIFTIEQSLVLAFQQEYEGAVKTLLPVLEGIARKHLEEKLGRRVDEQWKIIQHILGLKDDIVHQHRITYYEPFLDHAKREVPLSVEEIKELTDLDEEYFSTWCGFLHTYFESTLFERTKGNYQFDRRPNRHVIFHGMLPGSRYDFNTFMKVYMAMQFLTWLMLEYECKSTMSEGGDRFIEKAVSYQRIALEAQKSWFDKHVLYEGAEGYENHFDFEIKPKFEIDLKPRHKIILLLKRQEKWANWRADLEEKSRIKGAKESK